MLACIVSCDIVGHAREKDLASQRTQLASINNIVKAIIESREDSKVIWAARGDGGHVVFLMADWAAPALETIIRLREWSIKSTCSMRIVAHVGDIDCFEGADGRTSKISCE